MTPPMYASLIHRLLATTALLPMMLAVPAGLAAQGGKDKVPQTVSPGSSVAAERLAGSCPTFSWSGVAGASGYELVLYRVTDGGAVETVVQTQIAGDARGWTPSAAQCPASDNEYAWAVRALTEDGAGAWSEPLLFRTPGVPSEDEVRRALETLRRYRDGRDGDVGEGLVPSRLSDGDASDTEARHRAGDLQPGGAEGADALTAPTLGSGPSPQAVIPPSSFSLSLDGDMELGGFVFKGGVPFLHNVGGSRNTALGLSALVSATPDYPFLGAGESNSAFGNQALNSNTSGYDNTAVGNTALRSNTTGHDNTAVGEDALFSNTIGSYNTAVGEDALYSNTSGFRNTAVGWNALSSNTTALRNTAVGMDALRDSTGTANTAVGTYAGVNWTTGQDNIALGSGAYGVAGESGTIRIGGTGQQSSTFIEGIFGATAALGTQVFINSSGHLGITTSSARFKQDIHDLEGTSDRLLDLRPVSFRYKDELVDRQGEENPLEYGLVAEEVAEVFPELVVNDDEGRPYSVRYHLLTPLLLGEIQRLEARLDELRLQMAERDRITAYLRRRLEGVPQAPCTGR